MRGRLNNLVIVLYFIKNKNKKNNNKNNNKKNNKKNNKNKNNSLL